MQDHERRNGIALGDAPPPIPHVFQQLAIDRTGWFRRNCRSGFALASSLFRLKGRRYRRVNAPGGANDGWVMVRRMTAGACHHTGSTGW